MFNAGWALAALAATAAATSVAIAFDPVDVATVRSLDWPHVAEGPLWAAARPPTKDQQIGEASFWRVERVGRTRFEGIDADISLQAGKSAPALRRMVVSLPVGLEDSCSFARSRLARAYGSPAAERRRDRPFVALNGRIIRAHAQWGAGATTVTLDCFIIAKANGAVFLTMIEYEPAAEALPLKPFFALDCSGLLPPERRKKKAPPASSVLIFDSRELLIERAGDAEPVLETSREEFVGDDTVSFDLPDRSHARIDRRTGAYLVTKADQTREGVCTAVAVT